LQQDEDKPEANVKIKQKDDLCDFCGTCVSVCPVDAIELFEARLSINEQTCTLCKNCVDVCPYACLELVDEVEV
jgi:ferredoxin